MGFYALYLDNYIYQYLTSHKFIIWEPTLKIVHSISIKSFTYNLLLNLETTLEMGHIPSQYQIVRNILSILVHKTLRDVKSCDQHNLLL